jgi:uncharacterized membrane protein
MIALSDTDRTGYAHSAKVREISTQDIRWALAEGWADFRDKRGELIILGFIYPVAGLLAAVIAANSNLFPILFPLVAGLAIAGPVVAVGFYEIARRRERGEDPNWLCFFEPFVGPARYAIFALSLLLAALFTAWLIAAWAIYEATLGRLAPAGPGEFLTNLFATPEGWAMIVAGNLVGFAFAALVLAISVASLPMALDRGGGAFDALSTSIEATRKNPKVIALWGLMVAVVLAVAAIPLFIGLALALPVLGYATWHLYTRLVER